MERQKAYDALKTYKHLTYLNPPKAQIGYQEIEHLLNSTSSAANEFRAIYNGYVVSFKSFGYSDEEAQVMAGRTIAIMMINGLEGHFALPIINRALKGSKLSTANESKTSNITGKLDKDYFESVYGKENVQQGGGNYKEIKDNINNNHAANQQANKSSNFDEHVVNEKGLENAGKGTSAAGQVNSNATNIVNGTKLNAQLVGEEIAGGHAFDKHVIKQGEFKDLSITTKEQFALHIEKVVSNPTSIKELNNGRLAYWDQSTGTVVIRNPKAKDGGTAFRPTNGRQYFDDLN